MRLLNAIKQIKPKDFLAPLVFLVLFVPSIVFRTVNRAKHRKLWLVTEGGEARDNGYHFFKYIREKYPDDFCFYVVKTDSVGYEKVLELGNIIKYASLKHWLYYMSANLNISSQKSGNPCPIFWYFMHVILGLYKNRVFLQHGITKDDADWLYYKKTKFKYFICGAKREYDYIRKKFGYLADALLLTGFPRWDTLRDTSLNRREKSILIMPTWRNWLGGEKNTLFEIKNFQNTNYYKYWNGLLNDEDFIEFVERNKIIIYFYPHINMQIFLDDFKLSSENIKIISYNEDIQEYLGKCKLMITDYSSVAFDFAYLNKPVIYYQFDLEDYRKKQYREGYFDYEKDGFGPVSFNRKEVLNEIKYYIKTDFNSKKKYSNNMKKFFLFRDRKNSERVYRAIK
ncbi:CDP-glycerol glycerophosphotransferase family protein [Candidatus Saccharibacteria bacterium]|nr:CDP-glycerol glycerophosphotransferase family protein [Candidatus Saccharibacteria bacterium]